MTTSSARLTGTPRTARTTGRAGVSPTAVQWAMTASSAVPPFARLVLLNIAMRCNENDGHRLGVWEAFPGMRTIAADLDAYPSQVQRAVIELEQAGLLTVTKRGTRSTLYRFPMLADFAAERCSQTVNATVHTLRTKQEEEQELTPPPPTHTQDRPAPSPAGVSNSKHRDAALRVYRDTFVPAYERTNSKPAGQGLQRKVTTDYLERMAELETDHPEASPDELALLAARHRDPDHFAGQATPPPPPLPPVQWADPDPNEQHTAAWPNRDHPGVQSIAAECAEHMARAGKPVGRIHRERIANQLERLLHTGPANMTPDRWQACPTAAQAEWAVLAWLVLNAPAGDQYQPALEATEHSLRTGHLPAILAVHRDSPRRFTVVMAS